MSGAKTTSVRETLQGVLPRGDALPEAAWAQRHEAICVILGIHVLVLPVLGVMAGEPLLHSMADVGIVAALTAGALLDRFSRTVRASFATVGLLASSALLVHFFQGLIELHFHFFVTIALVSLYQAWTPYLLGVGFVLMHHALVGLLAAERVYNHIAAQDHPAEFALLHGAFILAESLACLAYWRLTEDSLDAERRQRAETQATNDALTKANRQISDLIAMLSHDLRTPVSVINGYSALALHSWDNLEDAQRRDFVERVGRAGHSLQELLEDTLAASAFQAGALEPRPQPVDLHGVLEEVLDALADPLPGVSLEGTEAAGRVLMDLTHLKQILYNVVSNAGKYGRAPYRLIAVTHPDGVTLSVVDSGPGVTPEFEPHLFERYSRSEEARRGTQKGTGLGLFIARALLHANGGDITYRREARGGSAFVLQLPGAVSEPPRDRGSAVVGDDTRPTGDGASCRR